MNRVLSSMTFAGVLLVSHCVLNTAAARMLDPGGTLILLDDTVFTPPDGTDASCIIYPIISLTATCGTDQGGQQFGVRTTARGVFDRGQGSALQFYDIDIDPGDGTATPLLAQISGKVNFNGFLAVVGGGQVTAGLTLKVLDLGPTGALYVDGGKVVHSESLSKHSIQGDTLTGPGFSISIEGGAPYIGASVSPSIGMKVSLKKELVRDQIGFGIQVLMLRGHTYRLQMETGAMAKKTIAPGLAIAQFKLGDDRMPDLIDPNNWLDGIDSLLDTKLPVIRTSAINILKEDKGFFDLFDDKRRLSGSPDFPTAKSILQNIADNNPDMPTSFKDIVAKRLKRSSLLEEGIENPGTEVRELLVTLQTDQVEILRYHTELLEEVIKLLNTPPGLRPDFPVTGHPAGASTSASATTTSQSTSATTSQTTVQQSTGSKTGIWSKLFQ